MFLTIILTLMFCLLVTAAMAVFLVMIPKFGATHFGAPQDIQEVVKEMPDQPQWKNILGMVLFILIVLCIIGTFLWGGWDAVRTDMNFWQTFLRFVIMLEGYKLYDIVFFDYLMLTRMHFIEKLYPSLKGAKGFDSFGFNAKSQLRDIVIFPLISAAFAAICVYVF